MTQQAAGLFKYSSRVCEDSSMTLGYSGQLIKDLSLSGRLEKVRIYIYTGMKLLPAAAKLVRSQILWFDVLPEIAVYGRATRYSGPRQLPAHLYEPTRLSHSRSLWKGQHLRRARSSRDQCSGRQSARGSMGRL